MFALRRLPAGIAADNADGADAADTTDGAVGAPIPPEFAHPASGSATTAVKTQAHSRLPISVLIRARCHRSLHLSPRMKQRFSHDESPFGLIGQAAGADPVHLSRIRNRGREGYRRLAVKR